jgi:hypothetical protein
VSAHPTMVSARNRAIALRRFRDPDDPDIAQAEADLRTAKLAEYIEKILADSPPLSEADKRYLRRLLTAPERASLH